jgi:hypothetical protein
MVVLPTPTMVTVVPEIVAIAGFELVYVNAPLLLDVGADIVKAASPTFFMGTEKLDIVGASLLTVRVAVAVPAR